MAAADYFLKIDGITGESVDSKHKGEIQLLSFSWGLTNTPVVSSGGGGAGKPSNEDFHFTATESKASPHLMLDCATGKHHASAILTGRKRGARPQEFLMIKMENVLISSYHVAGTGADTVLPTDAATLNFTKITYSFTPQSANGQPGQAETASFDFQANRG